MFFKSSPASPRFHIMRIYYKTSSDELAESSLTTSVAATLSSSGYFHSFRSCNLRFFNNLVITTKAMDELSESLRGICHTIQSTASYFGFEIPFEENDKLTRLIFVEILVIVFELFVYYCFFTFKTEKNQNHIKIS
jgi:hypothetical protein